MLSLVKFSKDLNCKILDLKTYPGRFFGYEKRGQLCRNSQFSIASTNFSIANSKFSILIR